MRKFPHYFQRDSRDCGPTCIKMISKFYGKLINVEALREFARISRDGVSLLGVAEASEKVGFNSRGVILSFEELFRETKLPVIIHWNQNHFVIITPGSKRNKILVADPARGLISYSKEEFCKNWITSTDEITGELLGVALLIEPTPAFYNQIDDKRNEKKGLGWRLLLSYLTKQKRYFLQVLLAMGIGSILQLIFPFITQSIVDTGISTNNLPFIYLALIAQMVLLVSRMVVEFIRSRLLLYISTHINASLLSDFWVKLMKLPVNFFETKMTGDIIQRLGDHRRIESFLTGSTLNILFSLSNLIMFSIVLLIYNSTIFLIFATGSILYFYWIKIFLKFRRNLDFKRFAIASKENSATMQLIFGMQEIKLNNAEQLKRWDWENIQAQMFKLGFKSLSISQMQQAGVFFINEGKNIFITFFVAKAVLDGQLTLGAMIAIQYIIGQLNSPVEQLIGFVQSAQDAKISLERLNEIHELEDEEPENKVLLTHLPENKGIQFSNLEFTYPGAGNEPVLRNINLFIPEGKVTALVGMSGSGKTTLLKLLLKFYSDYHGEIKIGESDLKHISSRFWRSQCGSVMQDGYIFSDSIEKNIAVSDESPDYKKLVNACKVANILEFIENLPLGFNTKIGAEGNGISAGQKQRLLIARAVYKNPEYLFFDEASNALDANNEKAIMVNLAEFSKGKTVVVVAHRLSTVKGADNIVVLNNGQITECGSHEELTRREGEYYQLVKNQLELGN